jgi:hypothetical protein
MLRIENGPTRVLWQRMGRRWCDQAAFLAPYWMRDESALLGSLTKGERFGGDTFSAADIKSLVKEVADDDLEQSDDMGLAVLTETVIRFASSLLREGQVESRFHRLKPSEKWPLTRAVYKTVRADFLKNGKKALSATGNVHLDGVCNEGSGCSSVEHPG